MLAVFLDRTTMQHERHYPHPVERVWEAVSTGEHLDVWLLPVTSVDARLGGRCSFSWGGPAEQAVEGEVTQCDPPKLIQYTFGHPLSFLRFELEPDEVGTGTTLRFVQSFRPGEAVDGAEDGAYEGADRPAGTDTPWRPGFVAGFHEMLDQLDLYLAGRWTMDDTMRNLGAFETEGATPQHRHWIDVYRRHIRDTCPPT
jgi:uncharacterized protein YndB with AHSA1/START domain